MRKILFSVFAFALSITTYAQSEIYPQHFDLEEVCLLDGPLKTAQDLNIRTLLNYDADRLMTPFVRQAGLSATTDASSPYYKWETRHPNHENWGSGTFRLDGHVGGHYLSALALAYAACHDSGMKAQLKQRIQHLLPILSDCQSAYDDNRQGLYGFIGGQPCNDAWKTMYGGTVPNFGYSAVPLYCQHKILAGLRDIALYCDGDEAATAKTLFRKLCDFHLNLIAKLTDSQLQSFLNTEHGGVNETLADAYRIFGDQRYLAAAKRYSHTSMINGMQTLNKTFLDGKHANTQVPKYIGFARIAQEDASATTYKKAALNFWQDVAENRTVCIGGNSVNEHFTSATAGNRYMDETNGPESCNSNNMLKLSENLFDDTHDSRYADFYEGAMYNHILSTIDPETGGYVYFTPLRPQSYRIYSVIDQDMWCCVGTGMENHSKYGHFIYTHDNGTLYVNLFTASTLNSADYALTQQTAFPEEEASRLTINKGGSFRLAIRKPSWVADGYRITVNGGEADYALVNGYAVIDRGWSEGDVVEISLPMTLRYEPCPNLTDYIAFKRGPVLLAARTSDGEELSHEYAQGERMGHAPDSYAPKKPLSTMPMLLGDRKDVLSRIGDDLTLDVSRSDEYVSGYAWRTLKLAPYFSLHHSRVSVYFYQQTLENYLKSTWAQEEAEQKKLDDRTIDRIDIGQQQAEAGCVTYSEDSSNGTYNDEDYRDSKAGGWIEAKLNNLQPEAENLSIMLRYTTADKGRKCTISVNGELLTVYTVPTSVRGASANGFYNLEIPLGNLAFDKDGKPRTSFTIHIAADQGTLNPGLYYLRLMRDYATADYSYRFVASDWAYTGDAGRLAQSKISVDSEANTITMTQSGANNVCLKFGSSNEHDVRLAQKYLVIRGANLNTASATAHYLWWLNGANAGSQVAPTSKRTLSDGQVQLAWDITKSGIDKFCKTDPWTLTTANNALSTLFGLTAKDGSQPVVISYIGFMDDEQLSADDTAIQSVSGSAPTAKPLYFSPSGIPLPAKPRHGLAIVRQDGGVKTLALP